MIEFLIVVAVFAFVLDISTFLDMWGTDSDLKLFWLPNQIVNEWCKDHLVGKVEHCIIDIWMNIVLLPTMLILLILNGVAWVVTYSICLFAWAFRKR
jgi:hypothetical protein